MNVYSLVLETAVLMILTGLCSELLALGTEELERRLDKGMAGGVILGLMTAFPETVFVIVAILDGFYQVALGSAIGGNMILFTVGMGIVSISYSLKYKTNTIKLDRDFTLELKALVISLAVLSIITIIGELNLITGIISLMPYIYYVTSRYRHFSSLEEHEKEGNMKKGIAYLLAGGVPLVFISDYFVSAIQNLSLYVGFPAILVSLILMPIAGELEEKVSAVRLIMKSPENVTTAVMSFVGSKIENMSVLIGIIGIFSYGGIALASDRAEFVAVILVTLITTWLIKDRNLGRIEGLMLLSLYFILVSILAFTSA